MTPFDRIREKNKLIAFIVKLQNTALYPALFALVCVISGTGNKEVYLPCIWLLTLSFVFAGLFSDDLKVFIVPTFLAYYAIGMDTPNGYYIAWGGPPPFDLSSVWHFVACGLIMLSVLIYRLISGGLLLDTLKRRGLFTWGFLFLGGGIVLGGIFSPSWTPTSLLFGAMIAAIFIATYPFFLTIFANSKDGIAYACKTLVCLGYAVLAQITIIAFRLHEAGILISFKNGTYVLYRSALALSWGVATIIGGVIVLAIAAAVYLMHNRKYPLLSFISALIFWVATVLIDTRSAIIFGGIMIAVGCIVCCISGRNRTVNRLLTALSVGGVLVAVVVIIFKNPDTYSQIFHNIFEFLRLDFDLDSPESVTGFFNARIAIWIDGLKDFLASPIFGGGFAYGYFSPDTASSNFFSNMYHNLFVQFLASMGVVGLFTFLIHAKHLLEVTVRRFSAEKLLLLALPICILGMSMVDNFFFYPNFIIVYTAFLAAAEVILERSRKKRIENLKKVDKNRKPRVVFTFVEAGKGHIVPTRTVCDEFRKHYGDRCEIVESRFFSETGDPLLLKTETLFRRGVQQQARSPIVSLLCKLGNLIAGDTFMLVVLLRLTISGLRANPRAVKHVEELDADIIYSAHWSVPFYVNQLRSPRPYTICFCPDVYSNGAFNVDCNNFLISSDVGYWQVNRIRMYAGGNITKIPFPIRPQVEDYKGKKQEFRKKLGIPEDEFVVVLCDGGYGMAKLEKTVNALLKAPEKMTVIALCGTNEKLYKKLKARENKCPEHIRLITVDFTDRVLEYITAADIFAGKSGANSIAEPASLGVPIIITKCATYIEKGIKKYYVRRIKGALYIPSARVAARRIRKYAADPTLLTPLRDNLKNSHRQTYDSKASADLIWQRLCEIYKD